MNKDFLKTGGAAWRGSGVCPPGGASLKLAGWKVVLLFLLFCPPHIALAQQPLFRFPAGAATWTVTCAKKTPAEKKPEAADAAEKASAPSREAPKNEVHPQKIEVAQTEKRVRSVIQYSNGRRQELWSEPGLGVILTEDPSGKAFVTRETTVYGDPFNPSYFDWIKKEALVENKPVQFEGLECYHYRGSIAVPDMMGLGKPQIIPCEAWINTQTLQPVGLLRGNLLGRFSFGTLSGSLEMPEKFQERLTYYKITMGIQN